MKFGENCVVIGLGLIGQITCQILNASGIILNGISLNPNIVDLAKKNGEKYSFIRHIECLEKTIMDIIRGYGAEAVIGSLQL